MIQALIFDFDGTILETEMADYVAWQEAYQDHHCELPLSLWLSAVGGSDTEFDPHAYLEQQVGRTLDRSTLRDKRRTRMSDLIADLLVRPGVVEVITEAKQLGLRLGVASSSGRDWVEGHLTRLGLHHHFEAIFTRDDVVRVKPDPALYTLAVNALGIAPAAAVAIEDSRNGMLAAKAAGLKCLVVPNEVTQQLHFPEADLQMTSLADYSLAEWLQTLQTSREVKG